MPRPSQCSECSFYSICLNYESPRCAERKENEWIKNQNKEFNRDQEYK